MNLTEYKSGVWKEQYRYKSFQPTLVNRQWSWNNPELDTLLAQANLRLGELNGLSQVVPDLDRYIKMHVIKEAQTSSRIEGTQTGMDEAVEENPEDIAPEKRDDWREVRNYIAAMRQAIRDLETLPLSNRLLCQTHKTLMAGTRGEHKTPGEFRRSQNWIGGSGLADAAFIPPHHEDMPPLLGDLEAFWHNTTIQVPDLIRIAISHYQFETIHPFLDGNGRIGRLLITLYLVERRLLREPCLYLSTHLEKNRGAYYDALDRVRATNDLNHWIRFFLVAVSETARHATETFKQILALRKHTDERLQSLGRASLNAIRVVDYLYQKPVVTARELAQRLNFTPTTANRTIRTLMDLGILEEISGRQRNRRYIYTEYFRLFLG